MLHSEGIWLEFRLKSNIRTVDCRDMPPRYEQLLPPLSITHSRRCPGRREQAAHFVSGSLSCSHSLKLDRSGQAVKV
jgi:hypothetical protein